ncbi:uncharacterized protein CELE_R04E5.7 [Caenorhabditis elegans]|uniref:Uncharacterized protein n=1 Tax=Caenorhabditis elegans TaxID=6239 RepID=Q9GYL5_CAEEL|nr:Uncharacterized protein CELE_R04E5.7 [Caenorhabditis elegans]CCD65955.1 Uncharacterized protein CELE_R04E5.7 [Caenorhabditis elegans]|eukprot:NP_509490.2 Uncharacterized protein CELE_R04E5.7 [Caenorhabditis elegans]
MLIEFSPSSSFIHFVLFFGRPDSDTHSFVFAPFAVHQSFSPSFIMMHIHRNDLLTIESTSASKPSLLSSFWSINVQVQNNERLDLDPKTCSQFSLPEVAQNEGDTFNVQRPTRSLSGK